MMLGRIRFCTWKTHAMPGAFVWVLQMNGAAVLQLNRPTGSTVGMWSFSYLPQIENLSLKRWSTLMSSCRKLSSVRSEKKDDVVAATVDPLGRGSLLQMSFR